MSASPSKVGNASPSRSGCERRTAPSRSKTDYYTPSEAFKDNGYATAHFGSWYPRPEPSSPLQHGFDTDIPQTPGSSPLSNGFCYPFPVWKNHGKPGDNREDLLAEEAVKFIAQHKERSASLEYWSFQAHTPWQAEDQQIGPIDADMVETPDEVIGRLVAALE